MLGQDRPPGIPIGSKRRYPLGWGFLVVQGDDDLGSMLQLLSGRIGINESVSGKEHKFQQWKELDGLVVAGALGVLTGPQAEV